MADAGIRGAGGGEREEKRRGRGETRMWHTYYGTEKQKKMKRRENPGTKPGGIIAKIFQTRG